MVKSFSFDTKVYFFISRVKKYTKVYVNFSFRNDSFRQNYDVATKRARKWSTQSTHFAYIKFTQAQKYR